MQKFQKKYRTRSAECDKNNQMRLRSLFNLFQDIADLHAESLGLGYTFCIENNLTWMGSGYHVKINRLPQRDEELELYTWTSDATPLMAIRDFELKNDEGETLVCASSCWILIDLNKKRPIALQQYIGNLILLDEKVFEPDLKKISLPEEFDTSFVEVVRQDDIDINLHVNNAVYPSWILDTLSDEFLSFHDLKEMKIQFKQGITKENKVAIFSKIMDNNTYSLISDDTRQKEYAKVVALWQKK